MKLISWNVNGIRAAVRKGFADVYAGLDADLFCIQETKAQDDQVLEALQILDDRHIYYNSAVKKGYSGTCIIAKEQPSSIHFDIGVEEHDQEGRVTRVDYKDFNLVNVYVPNSGSQLKRLEYRATWDKAFSAYLKKLAQEKPLIVCGDYNVAPTEIDLARPKQNYNKTSGYTQVEIDGWNHMLAEVGLVDSFRHFHPDATEKYTFWNQRFRARDRNVGWRIDTFLVTENLIDRMVSADIHPDIMGSDHCPVSLVLK